MKVMLLGDSGDLMIKNGAVSIGNADAQNVRLVVELQKGELKEYPTIGFGVQRWLNNTGIYIKQQFINELQIELSSIGVKAEVKSGDNLGDFQVEIL